MSAMSTWSPTEALTPGVTLIEASAGTGKTYNITSLVVRLVVELGVPIARILVVTYTKAATAELNDRVRQRLSDALGALSSDNPPDDPVYARLWSSDPGVRRESARRLRAALGDFDQVLISTIHGFCQRMLQVNAFESGVAFDLELVPDLSDLVEELVDDHLSRLYYEVDAEGFAFLTGPCGFTRDGLKRLAEAALADPDIAVLPALDSADPSSWEAGVAALAASWSELGAGLVRAVDEAVVEAKAGRDSVFTKGQRTYTAKKAQDWVDAVADWLGEGPRFGSAPPDGDRFTPAKMKNQLNDPDDPLVHPAIDALGGLLAVPDQVAGAVRAAFVHDVRQRFEARKAQARVQAFQDLLRGLSRRLDPQADPEAREPLKQAIGGLFDAALIDEFQDTDHHQWTIFRQVFGGGGHHLYLIGDPKQAIYGFRGANVHVYSQASEQAGDRRFTMGVNWRSDQRLLEGLNHVLGQPGTFGPSVPFGYVPVSAPPDRGGDGLDPAQPWSEPAAAPLQVRWFDQELVGGGDPDKALTKGAIDGPLEDRVAGDVVALLTSGARLRDGEGWRPVQPGDIAVLVRKGRQAVALQGALQRVGVPAVLTGADSVLASDEARELQHWLEAVAQPSGRSAARVAASTRWFGWSAAELAEVEAELPEALRRWDAWLLRLVDWRETLRRRGFMGALRKALDDEGVVVRLLGFDDGERRVTNLHHVAELVHAAEKAGRLTVEGLVAWLTARRSDEDLDSDDAELRLDRDADAVRLLTVHKSKGLEFPVCFVPYLWDGGMTKARPGAALVVPDPADRTRRLLDVGVPPEAAHTALSEQEDRDEGLRLAYVALTRARHRCVVYAGWVTDYEHSALAAVFHGRAPDRVASGAARVSEAAHALLGDLEALAAASVASDGVARMSVRGCEAPTKVCWDRPEAPVPQLGVRPFTRQALDPGWRRHSYSSVTRAAGHPELVEDGREGFDADGDAEVTVRGPAAAEPVEEVPLAGFPGGAEAGTLLHEMFEHADFAWVGDGDVPDLSKVAEERMEAHGFDASRHLDTLVPGLQKVFATPLGGILGAVRLQDVPRSERLDELRFDLPILGGARAAPSADPLGPARGLVGALRDREDGVLPDDWLASLDRLDGVRLAGFLTGSIDLVFRAAGTDGAPRWFVADYKSNRIDPRGTGRCVAEGFTRASMTAEMARHDYFLQYHLYLVALHRYLRWRLPNYDYEAHVGGVYYLFFRGMVGPDTEQEGGAVRGCWFDRPPLYVVETFDRALAGEVAP
jgi:exodeoxyribonuclease V beta subunit